MDVRTYRGADIDSDHYLVELPRCQDDEKNDINSEADDGVEPAPMMMVFKHGIKMLKNNKAAGKDGIGAKLIKLATSKLIVKIWEKNSYGRSGRRE
ncbi:conserved hypothetical protein [Culex quinquefasciatus]|uniref:Uncharacterized protein n=1 Tax=Culex quinquefasciatus TaxID=7176 RepID=B0XAU0_CULQU|nr:conserved hypothetical protein [Culex quinquefasciatus]|eukprot:XP_001866762.1 conserved hypothetical protein [Culex quinquefasciatus]